MKKFLLKIAQQDSQIFPDPVPMALFKDHGAISLNFELRVQDSLIPSINRVFNEEGIDIPFPQWMLICMSFPKKAENEEVGAFWFCE